MISLVDFSFAFLCLIIAFLKKACENQLFIKKIQKLLQNNQISDKIIVYAINFKYLEREYGIFINFEE